MADLPEALIDAPIAGQSLTSEVGGWPWEQPPQYSTVEEALEFYLPRLTEPTLQNDLMDVIEMGLPLTTIANALQQGAVMQGKHTLDVGILVMPVIMEMLAYLAEQRDIEFNMGTNVEVDDNPSGVAVKLALKKLKAKEGQPEEKPEAEEVEETEEPLGGLMSRRMV
jgi:hypothetical protein|tara:strand:+ start:3773 stop:4273 length:501 start_codon:yes stop_codon:yes gene_type:complete